MVNDGTSRRRSVRTVPLVNFRGGTGDSAPSLPTMAGATRQQCTDVLEELVGAPRFELGTPSPPDWCANRAALRSDPCGIRFFGHLDKNKRSATCSSLAGRLQVRSWFVSTLFSDVPRLRCTVVRHRCARR